MAGGGREGVKARPLLIKRFLVSRSGLLSVKSAEEAKRLSKFSASRHSASRRSFLWWSLILVCSTLNEQMS